MTTQTQPEAFDEVDFIMQLEDGCLSKPDLIHGIQKLVDSGLVWSLQGSYGRLAANLIKQGLVTDTHGVLKGQ